MSASLDMGHPDHAVTAQDRATAFWMGSIVLITIAIWSHFNDHVLKYSIYSLPVTLTTAYIVLNNLQIRIHHRSLRAASLYLGAVAVSMSFSAQLGFYATRDVLIIGGYLLLFVLWFRAPAFTADLALASLAIGMISEALSSGFGKDVDFFGSNGILESALAFPIGVVTVYYLHHRRWGRAAIAGILLFLAFKRIAFLGVAAAIAVDIFLLRFMSPQMGRKLIFAAVASISLVALFSAQLFEYVTALLNLENSSANSLSLGRYQLATRLWADIASSPVSVWLFGAGPGSADAMVRWHFELANPHNDWLKILYDYGVVGFVALHCVLFMLFSEHRLGLMLYLYCAVLMVTDNIFIYMFHHVFVFLIMSTGRR